METLSRTASSLYKCIFSQARYSPYLGNQDKKQDGLCEFFNNTEYMPETVMLTKLLSSSHHKPLSAIKMANSEQISSIEETLINLIQAWFQNCKTGNLESLPLNESVSNTNLFCAEFGPCRNSQVDWAIMCHVWPQLHIFFRLSRNRFI